MNYTDGLSKVVFRNTHVMWQYLFVCLFVCFVLRNGGPIYFGGLTPLFRKARGVKPDSEKRRMKWDGDSLLASKYGPLTILSFSYHNDTSRVVIMNLWYYYEKHLRPWGYPFINK